MQINNQLLSKIKNGLSYSEYILNFNKKIDFINDNKLSKFEGYSADLFKINFQRTKRIEKSYNVNNELCELIKKINQAQLWLILSEHWCGDSAQIVPYLAKIASCNNLIDLKILERDKNLDIMDLYLTNGTRSIPKLIAFDEFGNELFNWGPRPKPAQELIIKAKSEGKPKEEFLEELHLWYAKDQGKSIENEFIEIIRNLLNQHN